MTEMTILEQLELRFPLCWFKEGSAFSGGEAVAWSGEDSWIDELPAFNYYWYDEDPSERIWTMGVANELYEFCKERGYHWEAYDPGTYLLYKDD